MGAFFSLILAACGGSSGGGSVLPPPPPPPADLLNAQEEALAERLIIAHLDNGAYDWRQLVTDDDSDGLADDPDTSVDGFQNVTGVTAYGLLCAYELAPEEIPDATPALEGVKNYLFLKMDEFNQDPENLSVSLPNFIYMAKYKEVFGLSGTEWDVVELAFANLMHTRNNLYGTEPGVISDGMWNRIYDARAGIPGIRGWDLAFLYKALLAMNWPESELEWVAIELISLPPLPSDTYGPLGIAHVVEIAVLHGILALAANYEMELMSLIQVDGSIDGDDQATAYGLMALFRLGEDISMQRAYLLSRIGAAGEIEDSSGFEYFEFEGETLEALLLR